MSVANIFFMPDRILCLSDTLTYEYGEEDRPAYLTDRKTYIFGRFAVVARGNVPACRAVKSAMEDYSTIDSVLRIGHDVHELILDHKRTEAPTMAVETTIMGWSDEKGDLVAYRWEMPRGQDRVTFRELPRGMYLGPSFLTSSPPMPPDMDDARMVKVALAQHATAQKLGANMCIGGVMHTTEITADRIMQRIVGTYPDYDNHAAAFGCPNAEEVRRFREEVSK
ncbi:hypothetical protein HUE56_21505 [Azospirillum oryzae]|uniref:Uncharacterized protein n=1 Tax=Azospirillum oryzae TaxID=286727 RepID=A0A6N1AM07_9PROT|nr:hypothetical protein [Azospirillum oryzae]KAA0590561.1 hypothetical protein FZ938_00140 [Azospirillum oryzae]QKS52925.1 hypothetical protein HUE56_21505 [Azospirillum oryzae]GLR80133.1 hypothetical protein GCM10007856_28100 [Azospirillum oryzae]